MLLPIGAAQASDPFVIQAYDPLDEGRTRIRNGVEVVAQNDEDHTTEHATFAMDPVQTNRGIAVMMGTGRLDGPAGPNLGAQIEVGNVQGACMPFEIVQDPTTSSGINIQRDVENFKYVSQRQADDYRAFHKPEVKALGNGLYAIANNWDRNNNTNTDRYLIVVDSQCNRVPLTSNQTRRENNTSVIIMQKNNDNCSGAQSGGGCDVFYAADGTAHFSCAELCNGNGRDDAWNNQYTVSCATDGSTCDVQKLFDVSFIAEEERSRGRCEQFDTNASGTPDMSVCCGTAGNNQPQREGVWCAGIDHASENVIWNERVAYRGETAEGLRTYAMRMKMLAVRDINGVKTGELALQYQMHRGNNNTNRKGGYDDAVMLVSATPTRAGLGMSTPIDITDVVIDQKTELTHGTMFQYFTGTPYNPQPAFAYLTGSHNASAVNAKVMQVGLDGTNLKVRELSGVYDHQKYSKAYGNNPENQGRNFSECKTIKNPFIAAAGKTNGIPVFNACIYTGKMTSPGIAMYKGDLIFDVWSSIEPITQPDPDPEPEPEPDPNTDPDPEPDPDTDPDTDTGTDTDPDTAAPTTSGLGGCSVGSDSTGASSLVFLGLALVAIRRRRR